MDDFEISREGDTVDLIVWRRRKATRGVAEATFRLNPGLASYGPVLPAGVRVKLPPTPSAKPARNSTRIWS